MKLPELLSPAGDLERVQTALLYGADAVYLAGRLFGMRAKSVSLPDTKLEKAIRLIHEYGKKAYTMDKNNPFIKKTIERFGKEQLAG